MPNEASSLDIVIPYFNEESVLPQLLSELQKVFSPEACRQNNISRLRVLLIDDGSKDASARVVGEHIRRGFPGICYRLSRNFGHQNAVAAGLHYADADMVVIMDADLQDPPQVVWDMVAQARKGYDVVFAERQNRKDNIFRRMGYWGFYRLVAFLSDVPIPLDSGDFCLMRRNVVAAIEALPEKLRFPRIMRAWVGFRQTGVKYDRPGRHAGSTKYSLGRLYRLATDGIASASTRPLQITQIISVLYFMLSFLLAAVFLADQCWGGGERLPTPILILLLVLTSGFGIQCFCLYILGAYIGRAYLEVKGRPAFVVMETIEGTVLLAPEAAADGGAALKVHA